LWRQGFNWQLKEGIMGHRLAKTIHLKTDRGRQKKSILPWPPGSHLPVYPANSIRLLKPAQARNLDGARKEKDVLMAENYRFGLGFPSTMSSARTARPAPAAKAIPSS
jgi:hypothetical protein